MIMMTLRTAATLLLMSFMSVAYAAPKDDGHGHDHGAHAGHAHAAGEGDHAGGHGDAHGDGHGDDHGAHHYYVDDDDGDGTANWLDSIDDRTGQPNEDTYVVPSVVLHAVNLLILLGILVYFARRPLLDTLRSRAHDIKANLVESAHLAAAAESQLTEVTARLTAIESEVEQLRTDSEAKAATEKEALIARAHAESVRIAETAERNIRDEVVRAQHLLRREAVDLAIQLAENTLRGAVDKSDQQKLAREFLDSIDSEEAHV